MGAAAIPKAEAQLLESRATGSSQADSDGDLPNPDRISGSRHTIGSRYWELFGTAIPALNCHATLHQNRLWQGDHQEAVPPIKPEAPPS